MTILDIQEEKFNKKTTNLYELSILLGVDSFIYCICDQEQEVLALQSATFENKVGDFAKLKSPLEKLIAADDMLALAYAKVRVGLIDHRFTLVPAQLYEEKEQASYLSKVCAIQKDQLIQVDHLRALQAKNVYLINRDVAGLLRSYYPNLSFYHSNTPLLTNLVVQPLERRGPAIFGNIREKFIQLMYFDEKELVFSNYYSFQSSKDLVYYLLNLYHQFDLLPAEVPFILSGQIVKDSEIYRLVYRYIQEVKFSPLPEKIKLGSRAGQENAHFYVDLFSLAICG